MFISNHLYAIRDFIRDVFVITLFDINRCIKIGYKYTHNHEVKLGLITASSYSNYNLIIYQTLQETVKDNGYVK